MVNVNAKYLKCCAAELLHGRSEDFFRGLFAVAGNFAARDGVFTYANRGNFRKPRFSAAMTEHPGITTEEPTSQGLIPIGRFKTLAIVGCCGRGHGYLLNHRKLDPRGHCWRGTDALGCLQVVLSGRVVDALDELLRIAVDKRKPGGLNLDHDPVTFQEDVITVT